MKKIIFKPKPLSRAEQVYLKQLENRPDRLKFREIFCKANNYQAKKRIPQVG
jgi:hypothetical protein